MAAPEYGVPYLAEAELLFNHPHNRHDHREIQVILAVEGAMAVHFDDEVWTLPAGSGCAIEPARMHRAGPGDERGRAVILDLRLVDDGVFPLTAFLRQGNPFAVSAGDPAFARSAVTRLGDASRASGPRRIARVLSVLWEAMGELCAASPAGEERAGTGAAGGRDRRVWLAERFMEDRLADSIGVDEVARSVGLSRSQLSRLFVEKVGVSPAVHLRKLRVRRADHLLRNSTLSIKEIARVCGFPSPNHFSRVFTNETGERPSAARGG